MLAGKLLYAKGKEKRNKEDFSLVEEEKEYIENSMKTRESLGKEVSGVLKIMEEQTKIINQNNDKIDDLHKFIQDMQLQRRSE